MWYTPKTGPQPSRGGDDQKEIDTLPRPIGYCSAATRKAARSAEPVARQAMRSAVAKA